MYFVVYHTNGKVDVVKVKGRTFIQVCGDKQYSLMYLAYYEEVRDKSTRNFYWNGTEWLRKQRR